MMKYKGYYWALFAPLIKRSITARYSRELAEETIRKGKPLYRQILEQADDIGPGNPMAMDAYFAYVFVGAWLGSGKLISPEGMSLVMTDVLKKMRPFFGLINLNAKGKEKYWYQKMKKYEAWSRDKLERYPTTWKVEFDESKHEMGSYFHFTQCPICTFCQKAGYPEIMGPLCQTDQLMYEMQHGTLHREGTIASGAPICDYWIVGDQVKNPK